MTVQPRISTPARIRAEWNSKQAQQQNLEDSQAAEALTNLVFVSVPFKSAMKPKTSIFEAPVARRSSRLQRRDLHQSPSQPSTPDSNRGNPPANQVKGSFFVKWRDPISEMPQHESHGGKRKELRASRSLDVEEEAPSLGRHTRALGERRSKAQEDRRVTTALKGKAPARELSPPRKRRAVVMVSEEEEDEDERSEEGKQSGSLREQSWSRGYDTHSGGEGQDSDAETDDAIEAVHPKYRKGGTTCMRKPIEVDGDGQPFGSMKEALSNDVKKYAKDLDPRVGWEKQPRSLRKNLLRRLYTDWQVCGDSDKVNEKFLGPIITKGLITLRFRTNQLIDGNKARPADVKKEYWDDMVAERATEAAQAKSAQMRSISKGKASPTAQMRAIERDVVSRLTMVLGRAPFNPEIDAEVAKEYQRQQEDKRKVRPNYAREIEEVRSRVTELESSLTRLGENVNASNKRMEDMMRQVVDNQGLKQAIVVEDVREPSSSTKVVETSTLTSTTTSARTAVLQEFRMPMLKSTAPPTMTQNAGAPLPLTVTEVVLNDVSTDVAVVHADVTENTAVTTEELDNSHEVLAGNDLPEDHDKEDDVYSMGIEDGVHLVNEGVGVVGEANTTSPEVVLSFSGSLSELQEEIQAPGEPSTRPRRAIKTLQAVKAIKQTTMSPGSKGPTPKAAGLPKPAQVVLKVARSGKKAEAIRKK